MVKKEQMKEEPKEDVEKAAVEKPVEGDDKACKMVDSEEEGEEEESEDGKKKKKAKKAAGQSLNPEESASQSTTPEHTTTPGEVVGGKQNVFVPSSSVDGKREQETPMGKGFEPDLQKSPLFVNISKQLEAMQAAMETKVEALQKSVDDRMKNIKSDVEKLEKFYSGSFYKAASEEVGPESIKQESFAKMLAEGKVKYRN